MSVPPNMASISAQTEMDARGTTDSRESVVGHTGAICDDCGGDHGVYPVTQRGVRYLLCESCYEYAAMVAEADDDVGEQEDDFEAEEEAYDWDQEDEGPIVGSAAWWAGGEQDARDNGAYGLLTSAGGW